MKLDDYFDFLAPDDIRIKGTRIGLESVLYEYVHRAQTPEAISQMLPTVSLEQTYATILYYLHNHDAVSAYLAEWLEFGRERRREQARNPSRAVRRLRELKAGRLQGRDRDAASELAATQSQACLRRLRMPGAVRADAGRLRPE